MDEGCLMARWMNLVEPQEHESAGMIDEIEEEIVDRLHQVVRGHLQTRRTDVAHAFPRLENHFNRYLFGQFQVPTSADDSRSEFLEVTFVATFDSVWSVVWIPTATDLTDRFLIRLGRIVEACGSGDSVGAVVGRLMTVVVSELESFLGETGDALRSIQHDVLSLVSTPNLSRVIMEKMPVLHDALGDVRLEISSVGTVVDALESVLDGVSNDRIDLHRTIDGGSGSGKQEVFDVSTEIHLLDTWYRARRLKVLQDEQLEQAQFIEARMSAVSEHDELTSARFIGAIAAIMLVPTFIVGLYGMNFDEMPELHWRLGYGSVLALIVAVTIFQVWIFRRRRWI